VKLLLDNQNKKRNLYSTDIQSKNITDFIENIHEECEDHLAAINENTTEIQANYEYICRLDGKIEKISERLEQIQLFLTKFGFTGQDHPKFEVKPLAKAEQEVFLLLYTLEEKGAVTYEDISRRSGLTQELVSNYITTMIEKGVPIVKRYIHNKVYLRIDKQFKKIQAKENILKISQRIIPQVIENYNQ